jgi:hypothetical protein
VGGGDRLDDGEAETGPIACTQPVPVSSPERLEEAVDTFGFDAWSAVRDLDLDGDCPRNGVSDLKR